MKKISVIFAIILIVINSILGAFVFFNASNITNSWFNPETNQKITNQTFYLFYPPQAPATLILGSNGAMISIDVNITGSFLTDSPLTIIAVGSGIPSFLQNVDYVAVGFAGAEAYISSGLLNVEGGAWAGLSLTPNANISPINQNVFLGENLVSDGSQQIAFENPQTYNLIITIGLNNQSEPIQYTYPSDSIYVGQPSANVVGAHNVRFDYAVGLMTVLDIFIGVLTYTVKAFKEGNQSVTTNSISPVAKKPKQTRKAPPRKTS